jgi:hypothetical protein
MMSDAELLQLCADAFAATDTAAKSRAFLKKRLGIVPGVYAGSGQYLLAKHMIELLRDQGAATLEKLK